MNERQPYEKHLAEKLQQLPLPDAAESWPQMKALLEKEMPRGPGGWSGKKWILGIGGGILLLSMLFFGNKFLSDKNKTSIATTNSKQKQIDNTEPSTTTAPRNANKTGGKKDTNSKLVTANGTDKNKISETAVNEDAKNSNKETKNQTPSPDDKNLHTGISNKKEVNNKKANTQKTEDDSDKIASLNRPNEKSTVESDNASSTLKNIRKDSNKNPVFNKKFSEKNAAKNITEAEDISITNKNSVRKENTFTANLANRELVSTQVNASVSAVYNPDITIGDSIEKNYAGNIALVNNKTNTTDENKAMVKSKQKSLRERQSRTFTAGLSLPLSFPLGDQKALGYNFNGGGNTVSDYIPSPHVQFHVNLLVYLQTEVQFISPQYIQPILLTQKKQEIPGGGRYRYTSIYAKKLYYFNIPLAIHYSPFKNFYMGTGLQFSSLLSGIALFDERTTQTVGTGVIDTIAKQYFLKFRHDTLSQKLGSNEFRLLFDANYHWNRFTVGLRYNQALSNYVSLRINNTGPLIQDKNKSLQFYLRYNLWEEKKRRNNFTAIR